MNSFPYDLIVSEIFPKLQLSSIIELTKAYPPWLPITKKYIHDVGQKLGFDHLKDHRDIFKHLLYQDDIQCRFFNIKTSLPVIVYLLTISYNQKMSDVENELYPKIQQLYQDFEMDMNQNLDTIDSKQMIRYSSLVYVKQNMPREFLTFENSDFRIFHLFPTFSKKIEQLLITYFSNKQIHNAPLIIQEVKTDLNTKLYKIIIQD